MREVENRAEQEGNATEGIAVKEGRRHSSRTLTNLFLGKSLSTKVAEDLRKAVSSSLSPFITINVIDENSMYFQNYRAFFFPLPDFVKYCKPFLLYF